MSKSEEEIIYENICRRKTKDTIQLTCEYTVMDMFHRNHIKFTRVDPFLKRELTDFIDTMLKQKVVFLDMDLKNWVKTISFCRERGMDKLLICAEDYTVHESVKSYLQTLGFEPPAAPYNPQASHT